MRNYRYSMIFAGALSLLVSSSESMAYNCTQAPDCASLGYTMSATDCQDKIAVKCPTDSSKVFCKGAEVTTATELSILYGDGTVAKGIIDGKTPIGIVFDETNKLAVALTDVKEDGTRGSEKMKWSSSSCDTPGLENCDTSKISYGTDLTSISCGADGRANTDAILACGSSCGGTSAATAANSYQPAGCTKDFCKKTKWFLPSIRDLQNIYIAKDQLNTTLTSLSSKGTTTFREMYYWSSTEHGYYYAWAFGMDNGYRLNYYKYYDKGYVRPVIYYGEPKAGCDSKIAASGAIKVTTEAELKTANVDGAKILMMNDINWSSGTLTINAEYISYPGEFEGCSGYKRPTLTTTGNVTFHTGGNHSLGVDLKASSVTVPTGNDIYEFTGVAVDTFEDNNGQQIDIYGDATIGTWRANVSTGSVLFGADGGKLGVIKGEKAWNSHDDSRIIKIVINNFINGSGAPVVYGSGTLEWDNVEVTMPATMFTSISGDINLENKAKLIVSGSLATCSPAEVRFYGDSSNTSCFSANGTEICPFQTCGGFSGMLNCTGGKYSCP